ncbi:DUF4189 domain-containing protein [Nocardia terrae]|nr:DUF4189 domain-containing protein [Nocardia terrae]
MTFSGNVFRGVAAALSATAFAVVGCGSAGAEPGQDGHMYGSYAVSALQSDDSISVGAAWNFPDQASADDRAMSECGDGSCAVALRYVDACGAVAFRGERFAGGIGPTADDASRNAVNAVGPPWPQSMSADAMGSPAQVAGPHCIGQ